MCIFEKHSFDMPFKKYLYYSLQNMLIFRWSQISMWWFEEYNPLPRADLWTAHNTWLIILLKKQNPNPSCHDTALWTQRTTDWKPLSFPHPSITLSCLLYHFLISLWLSLATGDSLKGVDDQSIGSSLPHALAQWNITLRYIFRVQHSVPGQPYRLRPENLESSHVMLSSSTSNVFFKIQTLLLSSVLLQPLLQMPTCNKP